jgi:hypothetical protein
MQLHLAGALPNMTMASNGAAKYNAGRQIENGWAGLNDGYMRGQVRPMWCRTMGGDFS